MTLVKALFPITLFIIAGLTSLGDKGAASRPVGPTPHLDVERKPAPRATVRSIAAAAPRRSAPAQVVISIRVAPDGSISVERPVRSGARRPRLADADTPAP